jgi:hypothetical protein
VVLAKVRLERDFPAQFQVPACVIEGRSLQ